MLAGSQLEQIDTLLAYKSNLQVVSSMIKCYMVHLVPPLLIYKPDSFFSSLIALFIKVIASE